jgi:tape measure domain-containing protein
MNKSNFIETKQALDNITSSIDKQITSVTELSNKVIQLNTNYSKLPSEYLNTQKQIAEANNKIVESENKVVSALNKKQALTTQQKVDTQILNVEKKREATLTSNLAGEYRKLSTQVAIASDKYQNLIVRGRLAGQSQRAYNIELKNAQKEFRTLQTRVLEADKAVDKWGRTNERSIAFGRNLLSAFGVVGGVTAFATITMDIFNQTKEIQSLNKALELVTGTQENFYNQQAFISRVSEAYGVKINDLTKQYTQFYVSAKNKLAGTEIQQIFESITKAGASMGLSVESQQRAFLALNQMMSKGTIQAEELRGQLGEALPGAFSIMAKAVGVTEKELAKMMKAGDLISSEVLPKFAKQLEKTYGIENITKIDNLVSAQNRLSNAWRNFIASLDKDGNKLSKFLTNILNVLSDIVKGMEIAFESDAQTRKRITTYINETAKTQQLEYLNNLKSGQKEAIDAVRIYNRRYLNENNDLIRELESQNREILSGTNPNMTDQKSGETRRYWEKQLAINKKKIEELANVNHRYNGEIQATYVYEQQNAKARSKSNEVSEEQLKKLKKAEEDRLKRLEEELQLHNKLKIAEADRELRQLNSKLEDDKLYFNERLDLLDKVAQKETQIALLKYQENIRMHKDSNDQMTIDAIEFKNEIDKINKERVDNGLKELSRYYDEFENYSEKFDGEGLKLNLFGDDPKGDFEKWKQGAKDAKTEINELQKATEDWIIGFKESFIDDSGMTTLFNILQNKIYGFGTDWKTTVIGIVEVTQEAMALISQVSNQRFEQERENLDREYNLAIQYAGESASAKAEIDRQYEAKQREIKRREWKARKQERIVNILMDTAQAVIATLAETPPPAGIPLAVAVGAIGAIQLGIASAQKMPEYWTGTENAKEGWAWTQEKGREVIMDSSGKVKSLGNDKGATPTYLNRGDKVLNASKTMDFLMFNNELNGILTANNIGSGKTEVIQGYDPVIASKLDAVVSEIKNIPQPIIGFSDGDLKHAIRKGNTVTENWNNRVIGKGVKV